MWLESRSVKKTIHRVHNTGLQHHHWIILQPHARSVGVNHSPDIINSIFIFNFHLRHCWNILTPNVTLTSPVKDFPTYSASVTGFKAWMASACKSICARDKRKKRETCQSAPQGKCRFKWNRTCALRVQKIQCPLIRDKLLCLWDKREKDK